MSLLPQLVSVLFLGVALAPPSPKEILDASDSCYDAAFVGRVIKTHGFLDLNDILPAQADHLYLGGISSALVRKDIQFEGSSPKLGWVRVVLNTVPLRTTKVLLLTKKNPSDAPIVVYLHTLPRGAGSAEFKQALQEAPVERCS